NVVATHEFVQRIRKTVPPSEPIGVYSIGQFAFELDNPIIDLGGLVQPEGQAYLTDQAKMIDWARSAGARYFIAPDTDPGYANLPEVISAPQPVMGWKFSRKAYDQNDVRYLRRATPAA